MSSHVVYLFAKWAKKRASLNHDLIIRLEWRGKKMWRRAFDVFVVRRGWSALSEKFNFLAEKLLALTSRLLSSVSGRDSLCTLSKGASEDLFAMSLKFEMTRNSRENMAESVAPWQNTLPETSARSFAVYGALRRQSERTDCLFYFAVYFIVNGTFTIC